MNSLNINCTTKMTYLYILIGLNEFVVEKKVLRDYSGLTTRTPTIPRTPTKTSDTDWFNMTVRLRIEQWSSSF